MSDSLEDLRDRLRSFAHARDWEQFHSPKNLTAALAGEAGELVSILQWAKEGDRPAPEELAALGDEMADVMIYLVRLADVIDLDLLGIVNNKIDRNEQRFPKPHRSSPD